MKDTFVAAHIKQNTSPLAFQAKVWALRLRQSLLGRYSLSAYSASQPGNGKKQETQGKVDEESLALLHAKRASMIHTWVNL